MGSSPHCAQGALFLWYNYFMKKFDTEELKKRLTLEEFEVTQKKGTEPAFSGEYTDLDSDGMYHCKVCGQALFSSKDKFHSGSGWPSFDKAAADGKIIREIEKSHGMERTEVMCANCGAHLGHVFPDGPAQTTGERFCINSCALDFKEE